MGQSEVATCTRGPDNSARLPLGRTGRRVALSAHVISSASWLGIDVVFVVLVAVAVFTADPQLAGLCLTVLPLLLWPVSVAGVLSLLTGLLIGSATRWGVVRWRWVATKLAITLVYLTLIVVGLTPTVLDRATLGRALLDGAAVPVDIGDLVYPAFASPALLLTATVLSVVKPWSRIRSGGRAPDRTTPARRAPA